MRDPPLQTGSGPSLFSSTLERVKGTSKEIFFVKMISNISHSLGPNETNSMKENKSWEMHATYCLEGILTPVISFAGIIGKIDMLY